MYPWMREDARTADLALVIGTSLGGLNVDRKHALFTDADMLFTGDVTPAINMAVKPEHFPPRLMLVLSERWYPHVVREGFNTAAYYLNM